MKLTKHHEYKIWKGKNGYWKSYVPTIPKRTLLENKDRYKLIGMINEFYRQRFYIEDKKGKIWFLPKSDEEIYLWEKQHHYKHKGRDSDKTGYIYFITDDIYVKIGKSNDPNRRLLDMQTSNWKDLRILHSHYVYDPYMAETLVHKHYERRNIKNEWYDILDIFNQQDIDNLLKDYVPRIDNAA